MRRNRSRSSKRSLSSIFNSIKRTWKRRFAANKKLFIGIAVLIIALILFSILRRPEPVERISNEGYTHNSRFANYLVVDGIDVSEHQGEIDWDKVKRAGVDYVFVRVGYRGADSGQLNYDANYEYNLKQASKHGLMVGAYIYSQAITVKEAIEEAEFLVEAVKKYDIDLPLIIDYEFYSGGRLENAISGISSQKLNKIILEFCKTASNAGYDCGVYGNYNMLVNYLDAYYLSYYVKIWTAQFNDFAELGSNYQFWQCSDSKNVAGIEGYVDKDFWYLNPSGEYSCRFDDDYVMSVTACRCEFKKDSYKFKGWPVEPKVDVSYSGKRLVKNRDYTVKYIKNTAAGTGYAIIKGEGEYADIMAFPFTITE